MGVICADRVKRMRAVWIALTLLVATPAFAQVPSDPPPQLDQLVARIALYPDPLLAQVLAAAAFPGQVREAARWADQHRDIAGQNLADAMRASPLPWDPTVIALLPFPAVLNVMASDVQWTTDLGDAFLAQQPEVLDAVQRLRRSAKDFGYLKASDRIFVGSQPCTIVPRNPGHIFLPSYDPGVVF